MIHMKRTVRVCLSAGALALALASGATFTAAQEAQPYQPQLNQPGKDVQWVPTPSALVEKMLDIAHLTPQDRLVELLSGTAAATDTDTQAQMIQEMNRILDAQKSVSLNHLFQLQRDKTLQPAKALEL